MSNRNNSFDLIRHFAAYLVLYSYHFALSLLPEPTIPYWNSFGFIGVVTFFSISGFFMPGSYNSSGNFVIFMAKCCRRIFPGLIVCSFVMSYIIGGVFTSDSLSYLLSSAPLKTSIVFSMLMSRNIPEVFSNFLYKDHLNGSLWSLPVEFACYIIIGIALTYANNLKSVLTLFLLSILATMILTITGWQYSFYSVPIQYLAIFGIAFTGGALMSQTKRHWMPIRLNLVVVSVLLIMILRGPPEMLILGTLSLTMLVIIIGVSFRDKIINGKFDISYGIYIYAFPVQQIVINCVTHEFWLSMSISFIVTSLIAYLSYTFIEKPFLYTSSHLPKSTYLQGRDYTSKNLETNLIKGFVVGKGEKGAFQKVEIQ